MEQNQLKQHLRLCGKGLIHPHVCMERRQEAGVLCLTCDIFRSFQSCAIMRMHTRRVRVHYVLRGSIPTFMDGKYATILQYRRHTLLVQVDGHEDPVLIRERQVEDVEDL